MKQELTVNDNSQDAAEAQLFALIKEAGDEARARKREAMASHFNKLQEVIDEAVARRQKSSLT